VLFGLFANFIVVMTKDKATRRRRNDLMCRIGFLFYLIPMWVLFVAVSFLTIIPMYFKSLISMGFTGFKKK
jgi:hypothetical protein